MRVSVLVGRLLLGVILSAALFGGGALGAAAQEEVPGLVEVVTYFCENPDRVGETDITFAELGAAAVQPCRLATTGEASFTLVSATDPDDSYNESTDEAGFALFLVPPGDYRLFEDGNDAGTDTFTVVEDGYIPVTVVNYIDAVSEPPPPTGGDATFVAAIYVYVVDARAGETDFAIGGSDGFSASASIECGVGPGVELTLTSVSDPGLVYQRTTDAEGIAFFAVSDGFDAGTYVLTEGFNGATSDEFAVAADTYNLATIIAWVADDVEITAQIAVHKRVCAEGAGGNVYDQCHDAPLEGIAFTVNGDPASTDADGNVSFEGPAATVTITEDPTAVAQYDGIYVYCTERGGEPVVLIDGRYDDGAVTFEVAAGDVVVCDWYNLQRGATGTTTATATATGTATGTATATKAVTATATTGGTTTLPSTGSGSTTAPDAAFWLAPLALAMLGLGAGAYGLRRRVAG